MPDQQETREALEKALAKWRGLARMYGCTTPEELIRYIASLAKPDQPPF